MWSVVLCIFARLFWRARETFVKQLPAVLHWTCAYDNLHNQADYFRGQDGVAVTQMQNGRGETVDALQPFPIQIKPEPVDDFVPTNVSIKPDPDEDYGGAMQRWVKGH